MAGISGATGRAKRPGLDALLKEVARRDFNIVAGMECVQIGSIIVRSDRSAG